MKKSRLLQIVLGLIIAGVGLAIFFRDVEFDKLWHEIIAINPLYILAVAILSLVTLYLRAIRWRIILPKRKDTHFQGLYKLVVIGFMINNILPARIGEGVRAFLLWRKNGFTLAESVGSLVIERVLDILIYISFFFIPIFFLPELKSIVKYAQPLAVLSAVMIILLFLYTQRPALFYVPLQFLTKFLPEKIRNKIETLTTEALSNLGWAHDLKSVLLVGVLSFVICFCHCIMLLILVQGYPGFGLLDSLFGIACSAFGAAIPLSPGYVGTLHAALLQALTLSGIPTGKAQAITIVYHAIGYLTTTIVGLYFFVNLKMSFKEIENVKQEIGKK